MFVAEECDPSVLGGPPTFRGTEEVFVLEAGGAEESVRPGCANGSGEDSLPQRFPIVKKLRRGGRVE